MRSFTILAFLPDLFGVGTPVYVAKLADGTKARIAPDQISSLSGPVVSYETNVLIDQLRMGGYAPPKGLIEIGDALKLRAGRSKNDGGVKVWDFWRELHRCKSEGPNSFTKEIFFARTEAPVPLTPSGSYRMPAIKYQRCGSALFRH